MTKKKDDSQVENLGESDDLSLEDDLILEESNVETNLDPHLQDVLLAEQTDMISDLTAVTGEADDNTLVVDIIAKLHDPTQNVPGLQSVRVIGQIVTGTVRSDDIELVRNNANVISLKRATTLHPDLQFSVAEIQATADQLAVALPNLGPYTGSGVIVGVVDYGCDFVHRNFRNSDGTSRLLYLWDQNGAGTNSLSPAGYGYGREFNTALINDALRAAAAGQPENPQRAYQALAYQPGPNAHGTHVMDIAAGNGAATGKPGVAPKADLIFVQVAAGDYEDEESFGNSRRLLEAVDYIFDHAFRLGRPAVINISLGTHGGPHDGSTLVEQGFDTLLEQPARAIVISGGNSRVRRSHATGKVAQGQPRLLHWEIIDGDNTTNELEVWYDGTQSLEVALVSPAGSRLGPVSPGSTRLITRQGSTVGRMIHRQQDPNNGDNQIDILLSPALPGGVWQVELQTTSSQEVPFHAWIERDDNGQSRFALGEDDPTHTLGSISCGKHTLVVGSYSALVPAHDLADSSGEGPTRDGKQKPEVSAPGVNIMAAKSLSQTTTRMSGTSMAAPHVTGLVALLLQAAPAADIAQLRRFIMGGARRSPVGQMAWHERYGEGRVDVSACLTALAIQPAGPVAVSAGATSAAPSTNLVALVGEPVVDSARSSGESVLLQLIETLSQTANARQARVRIQIEVEPLSV